MRGIHWWPVNSPHKGPITWKKFPFNDVIMIITMCNYYMHCNIIHILCYIMLCVICMMYVSLVWFAIKNLYVLFVWLSVVPGNNKYCLNLNYIIYLWCFCDLVDFCSAKGAPGEYISITCIITIRYYLIEMHEKVIKCNVDINSSDTDRMNIYTCLVYMF